MKIIGVSGSFASGQDTLAQYLRDTHGFIWISTSDMVRKVSMERHGSIERPDLFETATYLRKTRGGGVLAEIGIEEFKTLGNRAGLVLSGIRSMGEVKTILNAGGLMIYTDADPELRYERMVMRQRDAESKLSKEDFLKREQAEWHVGDTEADFNKRDIRAYCEKEGTIVTNGTDLATFFADTDRLLKLHKVI
jgi:dephospho-CoA kinase